VRRVRCDDWDREYKGGFHYSATLLPNVRYEWFLKYVVEKGVAALRMEYGMKRKEKGNPPPGEYDSLHQY
jgi:hypothetical protein